MTTSSSYNDQIPTDPSTWAVLFIAVLAFGRLNHEQATALSDLLRTISDLAPFLLLGRR